MELNQITLPFIDYEQSAEFYRRLGLRQIVDNPPDYTRFETESGTTLSIQKVEGNIDTQHVTIYFEVADVDARVRELEAAGFQFDHAPVDQTWLWREAYLRDPAGNTLCIYNAGENRRFPPWRIGGNAV